MQTFEEMVTKAQDASKRRCMQSQVHVHGNPGLHNSVDLDISLYIL